MKQVPAPAVPPFPGDAKAEWGLGQVLLMAGITFPL